MQSSNDVQEMNQSGRSAAGEQHLGAALSESLERIRDLEQRLCIKSEELALAEELAQRERSRYDQFFTLSPHPYVITDFDETILEANEEAAKLLAVEPRFLRSKPLSTFIVEHDRHKFWSALNNTSDADRLVLMARIRTSDRTVIQAELCGTVSRNGDNLIRWQIVDTTTRLQTERSLHGIWDQIEVVKNSASLGRLLKDDHYAAGVLLERLLELATHSIKACGADLTFSIDGVLKPWTGNAVGLGTVQLSDAQRRHNFGPLVDALAGNETISECASSPDNPLHELAAELSIQSAVSTPLMAQGVPAVLTLYGRVPKQFTAEYCEIAETIGAQLAVVLDHMNALPVAIEN